MTRQSAKIVTSGFIQKSIYYINITELRKKKKKKYFLSWCQKLRFSEKITLLKLRCLMPLSAITVYIKGDSCLQSPYPCLSSIRNFARFPFSSQAWKKLLQYSDPISCSSRQPSHVALFRNVSSLKSIMLLAPVL